MSNGTDFHDFLQISYSGIGFLVNRRQFSFSMFLENEQPVKSRMPYFDGILDYNGERILAFNLDSYFKDIFRCTGSHKVQLVLLADSGLFSVRNRKILERLTSKAKVELSNHYLALKVGNEAEIHRVPLQQIYPMPGRTGPGCNSKGLLGIRFLPQGRAQFFVDVEKLVFNSIVATAKETR